MAWVKACALADVPTDATGRFKSKEDAEPVIEEDRKRIHELQEVLYAEAKHSLLIVFQAIDAGGIDAGDALRSPQGLADLFGIAQGPSAGQAQGRRIRGIDVDRRRLVVGCGDAHADPVRVAPSLRKSVHGV